MKRKAVILVLLLFAAYLAGPIIAGYRQIGLRDGPAIYPRWLHEPLFIVAHEGRNRIVPRLPLPIDNHITRRPLFYGMERTPRPDVYAGPDSRLFP